MRRIRFAGALLLGLSGLIAACSGSEPTKEVAAKDQPAAPKPITAEDRVKWYQDCWGMFNDKKWDDFKKCYAANATAQQMGYGTGVPLTGPDAIVAPSEEFAKAVPDGHGEGQLILVNGPHIASVFILKGTNTGPMSGPDGKEMPATNKKYGVMFGHAIDMDPTTLKAVKDIGVMDSGTFAAQLGLSKVPARPPVDKGADSPTIVTARNDAAEAANVDLEKAQLESWNKHDAVGVDSFTAADYVMHDFTSPKDQDKKVNSDSNKAFWKAFSDAKLNTSAIWGAGDYVAMTGTFEGTNDGDFPAMKLKKTGKAVTIPFIEIDRVEGGKFKESWLFFDSGTLAAQLGMMPGK